MPKFATSLFLVLSFVIVDPAWAVIVRYFDPATAAPTPGVWFENDVRVGGTASTVDVSQAGGNLENAQPLPIGAAKLTTRVAENADKAEVGVADAYGRVADIMSSLAVAYAYYKADVPGGNAFAAPSIKLTFYDPDYVGDGFVTLVYEPTWNQPANPGASLVVPNDVWTDVAIDQNTGLFWGTGGFGQPNTAGGPPLQTLAQWAGTFDAGFADADLVLVSIGVGTFNPGQEGYFDDVTIDHSAGGGYSASYDFEPLVPAGAIISFGVQGGMAATETLDGSTVRPADAVDASIPVIAFGELPSVEDIDAFHRTSNEAVIFSTTTSVSLGGTIYQAADLILWNGSSYALYFDGETLLGSGENIDAVTLLPQQKMLISTSTSATLYGFSFADGDVVVVDRNAQTAGLYQGLNEAALFTGTNQNIDALHYDWATGDLMISVVANGGVGTIAGVPFGATSNMHAKVIRFHPTAPANGSVYLDGTELFDGATRQIDAFFVPSTAATLPVFGPIGWGLLSMALGALGVRRIARRA